MFGYGSCISDCFLWDGFGLVGGGLVCGFMAGGCDMDVFCFIWVYFRGVWFLFMWFFVLGNVLFLIGVGWGWCFFWFWVCGWWGYCVVGDEW